MAVFNKRPRVGRNLFAPTRFYREPLIRDISQIQEQAKVKSCAVNPLSFVIKIGNRGKSYGSTKFIGEGDHVLFIGPQTLVYAAGIVSVSNVPLAYLNIRQMHVVQLRFNA